MKAIYIRVSTNEQSEQEQLPSILSEFRLDQQDHDLFIFRDEVTAWNMEKESKRIEFLSLKDKIKHKQIKSLYIWDLDRLYRNRLKTKEFFAFAKYYDCEIYSVNQKWLNEFQELKKQFPENFKFLIDNIYDMLLDVYAQSAQDESDRKSKRVKLKVVKKEGKVTKSVYGKRWGKKPLPKQTKDRIIELYLSKNPIYSMRKIQSIVKTTDKNKNQKNISLGSVHKTISEYKEVKGSN